MAVVGWSEKGLTLHVNVLIQVLEAVVKFRFNSHTRLIPVKITQNIPVLVIHACQIHICKSNIGIPDRRRPFVKPSAVPALIAALNERSFLRVYAMVELLRRLARGVQIHHRNNCCVRDRYSSSC